MRRAVILAGLLVAGCAIQNAEKANQARTSLVGMSITEIVGCAGVPSGRYVQGDIEVLAYSFDAGSRGSATAMPMGNEAVVIGRSSRVACEANFTFRQGRLEAVNYKSSGGGILTQNAACAPIIQGCLKQ